MGLPLKVTDSGKVRNNGAKTSFTTTLDAFGHIEKIEEIQVENMVEIVLTALASCLTAGVASVAQHRGIQLNSVTAHVEGDMDLQGILGIDADVRNGFSAIRVTFDVDADANKL